MIFRYVTEGSFDSYMWQALETKARFIGQIMTGGSTVRQAEDIGGAELSYAEVKAIASGNPAVLTLAETDAELQRLVTLRKHHADEQFLARRKLRELPVDIARLERRVAGLQQDIATAAEHAGEPITIGARTYAREDAQEALGLLLKTLPIIVHQTTTIPLGVYRGLRFGITLHPHATPDVQVDGAVTRFYQLARDAQGPRAILNAVARLVQGYEAERDRAMRDLAIAQTQHRDYEARLGAAFAHTGYLDELTALRNQLEAALSSPTPQAPEDTLLATGSIVARIKALQAAHTLEAEPQRTAPARPNTVEASVTTRIRQRVQEEAVPQPAREEAPPALAGPTPQQPVEHPLPVAPALAVPVLVPSPLASTPPHVPPRVIRPAPPRPPRLPSRQLALF